MPLAVKERDAIFDAIRVTNGDKLEAARLLGIGKTTLYRKLKEYGLADPRSATRLIPGHAAQCDASRSQFGSRRRAISIAKTNQQHHSNQLRSDHEHSYCQRN